LRVGGRRGWVGSGQVYCARVIWCCALLLPGWLNCCLCLLVCLLASLCLPFACPCLPEQQLVWPPMHHSALTYRKKLEVHLVYMVEGLQKPHPGDGR
jgi:hypothetical protein